MSSMVLEYPCRTLRRMALSHHYKKMLLRRWDFYTLLMASPQIIHLPALLKQSTGTGALIAPLIATQFASRRHWSFHYLTSCAIAFTNTLLLIWIFKFKTQNGCVAKALKVDVRADLDVLQSAWLKSDKLPPRWMSRSRASIVKSGRPRMCTC